MTRPTERFLADLESALTIPQDRKRLILDETRAHLEDAVIGAKEDGRSDREAELEAVATFGDLRTFVSSMKSVHDGGHALESMLALLPGLGVGSVLIFREGFGLVHGGLVCEAAGWLFLALMALAPIFVPWALTRIRRDRFPSHASICWAGIMTSSWAVLAGGLLGRSVYQLTGFLGGAVLGLLGFLALGALLTGSITRRCRLRGVAFATQQAFPFLLLYHLTLTAGRHLTVPLVLSLAAYAVATVAFVQARGATRVKLVLGGGVTMLMAALLHALITPVVHPLLTSHAIIGAVLAPLFYGAFMGPALLLPEAPRRSLPGAPSVAQIDG